jgi:hypothetical protein
MDRELPANFVPPAPRRFYEVKRGRLAPVRTSAEPAAMRAAPPPISVTSASRMVTDASGKIGRASSDHRAAYEDEPLAMTRPRQAQAGRLQFAHRVVTNKGVLDDVSPHAGKRRHPDQGGYRSAARLEGSRNQLTFSSGAPRGALSALRCGGTSAFASCGHTATNAYRRFVPMR